MKKHLFLALGVGLLANVLAAQDYKDSKRAWTDGPLKMDEFMGRKSRKDTSAMHLEWYIINEPRTKRIRNVKYSSIGSSLYFDKTQSWVDSIYRGDNALSFCQICFDRLEVYRRLAINELATNPEADYPSVMRFYHNQFDDFYDELADSTRNGLDDITLALYCFETAQLLATTTEVSPEKIPLGRYCGNLWASFGANVHRSNSDDYDTRPWGIRMCLGVDVLRHLFLLDVATNFRGRCKRDIGPLYADEQADFTTFCLTYGYLVKPEARFPFYPTFSIGRASLSSNEKDDDNKIRKNDGFIASVGCLCEIPFYQHVYLNGTGGIAATIISNQSIALKPSIGLMKLHHTSGWTPTFSLGIAYCWGIKVYEPH